MKHLYNSVTLQVLSFIFFSFFLSSSEYRQSTHSTPETVINFNLPQTSNWPNVSLTAYARPQHLKPIAQSNELRKLRTYYNSLTTNNYQSKKLVSDYVPALPHTRAAIQSQRHKALERFLHNDPEIHNVSFRTYCLDQTTRNYLVDNNVDIKSLELCNGTILQQIIHQEFIILSDTTAHLWNNQKNCQKIKDLTSTIADFTHAGILFNGAGEIKKAISLANAGWVLLDCIQAAGEGIVEGTLSVAYDIAHPIETVQNLTKTVATCGHYLGIALQEIDSMADAIIRGKFDMVHDTYTAWSDNCRNIVHALNEYSKELRMRDVVKTIATSAVQCYATTRAINGFGSIFNSAQQSAAQIAKKISEGFQESTLLMSAEGMRIRIAQETLKQTKKLPRAHDKLLQVLSQFEGQKIQVGKITCLLDKSGLKHILKRHHPKYWNGSIKPHQTFLNKGLDIQNIIDIIKQVIKQNRKIILDKGTVGKYQIHGVIKGTNYIVGFDNGKIGQFYIPSLK